MNDRGAKISYVNAAASLLVATGFFSFAFMFLYLILGIALTGTYNGLFPFIDRRPEQSIVFVHFILFLTIIFFVIGVLSAWLNSALVGGRKAVLLIGAASGALANVLPVLFFFILLTIINILDLEGYLSISYPYWLWLFGVAAAMAAFSAAMMALGSYCYLRRAAKGRGIKPGYALGTGIAAVAVLLVPLIVVYFVYSSGGIREYYGVPQFSASRLDNDTVSIAFMGYAPTYHPASLVDPFFLSGNIKWQPAQDMRHPSDIRILVNGKDASNASAIVKSGLNASISPTGGLAYVEGSSVTFAGDDIWAVNGQGTHIVLTSEFENWKDMPVYETTID